MSNFKKTLKAVIKVDAAESEVRKAALDLENKQGKLDDAQRELVKVCCHPNEAVEETDTETHKVLVCTICGTQLDVLGELVK